MKRYQRNPGKAYYFDPAELPVRRGSHVIVETARGIEYGTVVCSPMEIERKKCKAPVRPIIRMATPDDDAREQSNREHEREAFRTCQSKIRQHRLDMKLIDAEYTFDNSKILFYFTADGRVDFRSVCATRPRSSAGTASAEDRFAAIHICLILYLFQSRWPRSRIFR